MIDRNYFWPINKLKDIDVETLLNKLTKTGVIISNGNDSYSVQSLKEDIGRIFHNGNDWVWEKEQLSDEAFWIFYKHLQKNNITFSGDPFSPFREQAIIKATKQLKARKEFDKLEDYRQPINSSNIIISPKADKVFFGDVSGHSRNLLPLALIKAKVFGLAGNGWIPIVVPIEPLEFTIGEGQKKYYTRQCNFNWLGLDIKASKCSLQSDLKFFICEEDRQKNEGAVDWIDAYKQKLIKYTKWQRSKAKKLKYIFRVKPDEYITNKQAFIFSILDTKDHGNNISFPKGLKHNKKKRVPKDENGHDYIFVGYISSANIDFIEDDIYYYISQDGNSLALTIDHT